MQSIYHLARCWVLAYMHIVGSKIIGTTDQQCTNNALKKINNIIIVKEILYFINVSVETTKIITII